MAADDLLDVRDLDVCLDAGIPEQLFTLWPEDTLIIQPRTGNIHIELRQRFPGRDQDEDIEIKGAHVRWYSIRYAKRKLPAWPEEVERQLQQKTAEAS